MLATPALQREIKEGFLRDACRGLPGADEVQLQWFDSATEFGYRRRARLAWKHGHFGYRQRDSRKVAEVDRCIVLSESLESVWSLVRKHIGSKMVGEGEIQLSETIDGVFVDLRSREPQSAQAFAACADLAEAVGIVGVSLRTADMTAAALWGDRAAATAGADGLALLATGASFLQANEGVNRLLVEEVLRLAEPRGERVLELHCGIGNFTVALASGAKSLLAVEQDADAAAICRRNLSERGLGGRVLTADANCAPDGRYDVVVLDPPRQGARTLFETDAVWSRTKRIVYVSCDPASLRRDLQLACARGFRIDRQLALDMFPNTAHLESVVRLVR